METLTFIDVEASGLEDSSYPIQIGWIDTEGCYDEFLINPETATGWDFWDDYAESNIHKIPRNKCKEKGISVFEAAERLNRLLRGLEVISDAADYDSNWIMKLMNAAGAEPKFSIIDVRQYLSENGFRGHLFFNERKLRQPEHTALKDCSRNIHSGAACGFWSVSPSFNDEFGNIEILDHAE